MRSSPRSRLIEIAVEARSNDDGDRLAAALAVLDEQDSSLTVSQDRESGQTILSADSEDDLDQGIDTLKADHGLSLNVGAPQVAYRETITRMAEVDHSYMLLEQGGGRFARVKIRFEPGEEGSGFVFENAVTGGAVPTDFIPGVQNGLEAARENGLLAGFPVIDFKATLYDGAHHDLDSSVLTFEVAARRAFRELADKGGPVLLEPIMKVEILTHDEYMGDVVGDLSSRRGRIQSSQAQGDGQRVIALAPLANMFGYINTLRSFSQGRAEFTMRYDHYAPTPVPNPEPDPRYTSDIGMRA
jgi:elongation factor G